MVETGILENLKKAVLEYNNEKAAHWARVAIKEGIDPIKVANALTEAIRQIGDAFGRGELFLPELIGGAEAMQSAMPIIEEKIKETGGKKESLGTVVIGTVYGDIHSIGKDMVSTLLIAEGFDVKDLGVNVSAEKFIEAISEHKADILAMSALMTVTAPEQKKVIETLKKKDLRHKVKIMVGGGAITEEFAKEIGADAYGATASDAVKLARGLIGLR